MRLNVSDVTRLLQRGLRNYWAWMSSGSLPRFAIGYAVPILVFVLLVNTIQGDGGLPDGYSSVAGLPTRSAEVAGTASTPESTVQAQNPPAATPTVTKSQLTYVVKSGDSLGAICSAQVPSMAIDACVDAIVKLNKLGGPDQLSVGQSLSLPATGGTTSATTLAASPGAASATETPRPSSTGSVATTIAFGSVSTPLKPGQTANVEATGPANSSCSLSYAPPSGSPASAASLTAKSTDGSGKASWSWEIDAKTKKGKGLLVLTCGGTSISTYIQIS
jgi:LysM repeat protein